MIIYQQLIEVKINNNNNNNNNNQQNSVFTNKIVPISQLLFSHVTFIFALNYLNFHLICIYTYTIHTELKILFHLRLTLN